MRWIYLKHLSLYFWKQANKIHFSVLKMLAKFGNLFKFRIDITQNPNITKLQNRWAGIPDVNMDELNRFGAEHPTIVELTEIDSQLMDAIYFIGQVKSLKQIKFKVNVCAECDNLISRLDNKWQTNVSIVEVEFFIFMRKTKKKCCKRKKEWIWLHNIEYMNYPFI